MYLKRVPKSQ